MAIPITQALLMVVPAIVVWVLNRSSRKALSGYAVGALGAVVFDRAAAITLLVPQLAMGVTARDQSVTASLGEAAVKGIAWPLASLATGGVFGIALWTTFRDNPSRRRRVALAAATALLLGVMIVMGLVDIAPLSLPLYITLQLLIAALAMVGLRHWIAALLYEVHEVYEGAGGQTRVRSAITWLPPRPSARTAASPPLPDPDGSRGGYPGSWLRWPPDWASSSSPR